MINETLYHDEKQVFRARAGAAYNFPNGDGQIIKGSGSGSGVFPLVGTVPMSRDLEGLISTDGVNVLGDVDVNFNSGKCKVGDYLFNGGAGGAAVRKITSISDDGKRLVLEQAFPADLTDSPVMVVSRQDFKLIVLKNTHASTECEVQEGLLAINDTYVGGGAPIAYDASGGGQLDISAHR